MQQTQLRQKVSSTITINRVTDKWIQDAKDKNYVSKTYKATANAEMSKYTIELTRADGINIGGIKITDENNNERNEFYPNESFKVLVPIKDMKENTAFNLKAQAKLKQSQYTTEKLKDQEHKIMQ